MPNTNTPTTLPALVAEVSSVPSDVCRAYARGLVAVLTAAEVTSALTSLHAAGQGDDLPERVLYDELWAARS